VAELRNCSRNFAESFRVFRPEASYRRRGGVRGCQGLHTPRWCGPGVGHVSLV
jgi:hypothetical protein